MEKSLLARIKTLKLSYYGHIMRKANCLEKDIIQGCVPGSRGRGRPRRRWKEDISDWTGLRINDAARSAEDRYSWRRVIRAARRQPFNWRTAIDDDDDDALCKSNFLAFGLHFVVAAPDKSRIYNSK